MAGVVVMVVIAVLVVLSVALTAVTGRLAKRAPASRGPHYDDLEHHHPRLQDEDPTA